MPCICTVTPTLSRRRRNGFVKSLLFIYPHPTAHQGTFSACFALFSGVCSYDVMLMKINHNTAFGVFVLVHYTYKQTSTNTFFMNHVF